MAGKRTWTMSLAGGTSIVLSSAGLLVVGLAWLAVVVIFGILLVGSIFGGRVFLPENAGGTALAALGAGIVVSVSASLDVLLLATGISIWRVSRRARTFALAFAIVAIPFGVMDAWVGFHAEGFTKATAPLALFTPAYALGLLLAFYAIPSWRERLSRDRGGDGPPRNAHR